jgi:hypothetical protein
VQTDLSIAAFRVSRPCPIAYAANSRSATQHTQASEGLFGTTVAQRNYSLPTHERTVSIVILLFPNFFMTCSCRTISRPAVFGSIYYALVNGCVHRLDAWMFGCLAAWLFAHRAAAITKQFFIPQGPNFVRRRAIVSRFRNVATNQRHRINYTKPYL